MRSESKNFRAEYVTSIVALVFVAFGLGCAEPKYVRNEISNDGPTQAREKSADCSIAFKISGLCVSWSWEQRPTSTEPGSLIFKTFKQNSLDGTPIETDVASNLTRVPKVVLWMPGMGHGSSPTQTARVDVGTYRTSGVFFVMPGDWDIRFQFQNDDGLTDEAQVSITF